MKWKGGGQGRIEGGAGEAAERQRNTAQERLRALGSGDRSEIGESRAMPRRKQQAPKRAAGKEKPSTYTASVSPLLPLLPPIFIII